MPEEEHEYSKGQPIQQAIPNSLKWLWNKGIYDNMRYYRTRKSQLIVRKSFLISFLINILEAKVSRLKQMEGPEKEYGGVENDLKPKILKIYDKVGGYTSSNLVLQELHYIKNGTGIIHPEIRIGKQRYRIPIPDKRPLRFPDGYVQYPHYYGRDNRENLWKKEIGPVVGKIVKDALLDIDAMGLGGDEAERRKMALQTFADKSEALISSFFMQDREGSWYNMFNNMKGMLEEFKANMEEYNTLWQQLMNNRAQEIVYLHTYYKVKQYNVKKVRDDYVEERFKDAKHPDFTKRPDEVDWGLDDRGMSLEVVPKGGHRFIDVNGDPHDLVEGDILIDAFRKYAHPKAKDYDPGITIRRINPDFIEPVDLLEAVNYIHTEWDNFRDDFRDGRYHLGSLTVSDYIMAASYAIGDDEWTRKRKPNNIKASYGDYTMDLYNPGPYLPASFKNRRKASNLNPAFDLRVLDIDWKGKVKKIKIPFRFIGAKRYYAPDEIAVDEQYNPVITTRGLSMFIIEEVSRKGKPFVEIRDELISTGKKTGGYDYGPRSFGDQEFCMDPFSVDYQKVNEKKKSRKYKMA